MTQRVPSYDHLLRARPEGAVLEQLAAQARRGRLSDRALLQKARGETEAIAELLAQIEKTQREFDEHKTILTPADDHIQYALLAGRAGGQTLQGGTATGEDLTLRGNSFGLDGSVFLGSSSLFELDEATGQLKLPTAGVNAGLTISDVHLFRSAPDILRIADSVEIVDADWLFSFPLAGRPTINFDVAGSTRLELIRSSGQWTFNSLGTDKLVMGAGATTFSEDVFVLDSQGIVVGHTAQIDFGAIPEFQVLGTATPDSSMGFARFENNASGPDVRFLKSRGATIGANVIVQDGDTLGRFRFQGADTIDFNTTAAEVLARVDGAPSANDIPGMIVFRTRTAGGGLSDKLVVTAAGQAQLPIQGVVGGLLIGGDTLLYRSGANQLRTPDALIIEGTLFVDIIEPLIVSAGVTIDDVLLKGGLVDAVDVATHDHDGSSAGGPALANESITSRQLAPTIVEQECTVNTVLTSGTAADITGATITLTPIIASMAIVFAQYDIDGVTAASLWSLTLDVDGSEEAGVARYETAVSGASRGNAVNFWVVPLSAAPHTLKLRGRRSGGSGNATVFAIHTKLVVWLLGDANVTQTS